MKQKLNKGMQKQLMQRMIQKERGEPEGYACGGKVKKMACGGKVKKGK